MTSDNPSLLVDHVRLTPFFSCSASALGDSAAGETWGNSALGDSAAGETWGNSALGDLATGEISSRARHGAGRGKQVAFTIRSEECSMLAGIDDDTWPTFLFWTVSIFRVNSHK